MARNSAPFLNVGDIVASRSGTAISEQYWCSQTPRTAAFIQFFATIGPNSTPVELVEALHASGISNQVLDTLPEAILIPLREAMADCQAHPPVFWDRDLLNLVDRGDVNMFLQPEQQRQLGSSSLLVSLPPILQ